MRLEPIQGEGHDEAEGNQAGPAGQAREPREPPKGLKQAGGSTGLRGGDVLHFTQISLDLCVKVAHFKVCSPPFAPEMSSE